MLFMVMSCFLFSGRSFFFFLRCSKVLPGKLSQQNFETHIYLHIWLIQAPPPVQKWLTTDKSQCSCSDFGFQVFQYGHPTLTFFVGSLHKVLHLSARDSVVPMFFLSQSLVQSTHEGSFVTWTVRSQSFAFLQGSSRILVMLSIRKYSSSGVCCPLAVFLVSARRSDWLGGCTAQAKTFTSCGPCPRMLSRSGRVIQMTPVCLVCLMIQSCASCLCHR